MREAKSVLILPSLRISSRQNTESHYISLIVLCQHELGATSGIYLSTLGRETFSKFMEDDLQLCSARISVCQPPEKDIYGDTRLMSH